jgi:hypothetical protein
LEVPKVKVSLPKAAFLERITAGRHVGVVPACRRQVPTRSTFHGDKHRHYVTGP